MLTEAELRDKLQGGTLVAESTIDANDVIRRAKRRRAPRQIAVGSVTAFAVAGFTILGISAIPSLNSLTGVGADSAAISDAEAPLSSAEDTFTGNESNAKGSSGSEVRTLVSQCGETVPAIVPNPWGLELAASFPTQAPANGQPISGTATLTNTGTSRVQGTTTAFPTALLSRDGITVWSTPGMFPEEAKIVDLAPGSSVSYAVDIEPRKCSTDTAPQDQFGAGAPALGSGDIEVTVAIYFAPKEENVGANAVISGPTETIILR